MTSEKQKKNNHNYFSVQKFALLQKKIKYVQAKAIQD